jgi:Rpp20 subunit of nuclear RNase MRP and P
MLLSKMGTLFVFFDTLRVNLGLKKQRYKSLHLNAMGAAIPHLVQLSVLLPRILPFPPDDVRTEIHTGTVEVQDELVPDDEDEDISYQMRAKSTLRVVIKIGDGIDDRGDATRTKRVSGVKQKDTVARSQHTVTQIVVQEPEQMDPDI